MKEYICEICGLVYKEKDGWPEEGIPAGTTWEDVDKNWCCPICGVTKSDFAMSEIIA